MLVSIVARFTESVKPLSRPSWVMAQVSIEPAQLALLTELVTRVEPPFDVISVTGAAYLTNLVTTGSTGMHPCILAQFGFCTYPLRSGPCRGLLTFSL